MSLREGVSMHRRPTPQPTHIVPKQSTHHFTPQSTHGKVLTVAPESNTLGTRSTSALGPGSSLSSRQSHLHHHPPIRQSHHAVHGKQLASLRKAAITPNRLVHHHRSPLAPHALPTIISTQVTAKHSSLLLSSFRSFTSSTHHLNHKSVFSPSSQQKIQQEAEQLLKATGVDIDELTRDLEQDIENQKRLLVNTPDEELLAQQNSLQAVNSEDEFTEVEDPSVLYRFDRQNVVPEQFPDGSLEFVVATFLQAEHGGVLMFPVFLRKKLFSYIMKNLNKVLDSVPDPDMVDMEGLFDVILDTIVHIGPELCATHDQAINILFPLAPRIGDVVELPNVPGKCVLSKREYIDNRFDSSEDLDDFDRGRIMVLTYECLHPSVRGKHMKTYLPFEMEAYRLIITQNEKGLEEYMHHKGLIDMRTGKILDPQSEYARTFEKQLSPMAPLLAAGPGSAQLRMEHQTASVNAPGDVPEHLKHRLVHDTNTNYSLNEDNLLQDNNRTMLFAPDTSSTTGVESSSAYRYPSVVEGKSHGNVEAFDQGPSRLQKEYYRPRTVSGPAAMIMYKRLMQDIMSPTDGGSSSIMDSHKAILESDLQARREQFRNDVKSPSREAAVGMQIAGETLSSSAKINARGASYEPPSFASISPYHSTHNAPPVPNTIISLKEQQRIDRQIDKNLQSTSHASDKQSKIIESLKASRSLGVELVKNTETKNEKELEEENRQEYEEFLKQQLEREQKYLDQGFSIEEAQRRAQEEYEREDELHREDFLKQLEVEGMKNYQELDDRYKKKYADIIITKGVGAGLPDPLRIDLNDDILAIYKHANIALMDFLSEQWSLMIEEKRLNGEEAPRNADVTRYRLVATIAAAGNHAFTTEYIQEIFQRVMTLTNNKGIKDMLEEDEAARQISMSQSTETAGKDASQQLEQKQQDTSTADSSIVKQKEDHTVNTPETKADAGGDMDAHQPLPFPDALKHISEEDQLVNSRTFAEPAELEAQKVKEYLYEKRTQLEKFRESQYEDDNDGDDPNHTSHHKQPKPASLLSSPVTIGSHSFDNIDHLAEELVSSSQPESTRETESGYIKHNGKLYTPREYATLVFGRPPTPIEKAPIPNELKEFLLSHQKHRTRVKSEKAKKQEQKKYQKYQQSRTAYSQPSQQHQQRGGQDNRQYSSPRQPSSGGHGGHPTHSHRNPPSQINRGRKFSTSTITLVTGSTSDIKSSSSLLTSYNAHFDASTTSVPVQLQLIKDIKGDTSAM